MARVGTTKAIKTINFWNALIGNSSHFRETEAIRYSIAGKGQRNVNVPHGNESGLTR
jgi:hypothetical protein